jgi:hypothetical protein
MYSGLATECVLPRRGDYLQFPVMRGELLKAFVI